MKRLAILAALALTSCGWTGPESWYQEAVKHHLRDPGSAEFSGVAVNVESACGFVNSKNGFGGYVGKAPFVAVGRNAQTAIVTLLDNPTVDDSTLVNARCVDPAKTEINRWMVDHAVETLKALS